MLYYIQTCTKCVAYCNVHVQYVTHYTVHNCMTYFKLCAYNFLYIYHVVYLICNRCILCECAVLNLYIQLHEWRIVRYEGEEVRVGAHTQSSLPSQDWLQAPDSSSR